MQKIQPALGIIVFLTSSEVYRTCCSAMSPSYKPDPYRLGYVLPGPMNTATGG